MNSFRPTDGLTDGDRLTRLVTEIHDAGSAVMFVSPHLDDAVLSCGALLAYLARTCPVTVLTVFSSAARPAKWGLAARKTLRDSGVADVEAFYEERRSEDIEVLKQIGASWIHLGLTDALFRRVGEAATGTSGFGRAAYPTFRFDAARGRIASSDAGLAAELSAMIKEVAAANEAAAVFGPLGVGQHVDHLISRNAVVASGVDAVYYSDFPYSVSKKPDARFISRASMQPYEWLSGRAENAKLIEGYRTQFAGLFPHGVPIGPETYWIRAADSASAI
jgi:LmbE family N-acetylglucosaminyl deacetylase